MEISVNHGLGKAEAKSRIQNLLVKLKQDFSDKISDETESWTEYNADYSFKLMGMKISGNVLVDESLVTISGNLPFAVLPFKGMIESSIKSKAIELLK